MKRIVLRGKYGKGKYAIVDDEDYVYLNQSRWYAIKTDKGTYAYRELETGDNHITHERMGRLITKAEKGTIVAYKDRNTLNYRRDNLKTYSVAENGASRKLGSNNKSGYKGVIQYGELFRAKIKYHGKTIWLGVYDSALEAAIAYNWGASKYFGDLVHLNDIPSWQGIHPIPHNKESYVRKDSKTGIRGVSLFNGKYRARRYINGVHFDSGNQLTIDSAQSTLQRKIEEYQRTEE